MSGLASALRPDIPTKDFMLSDDTRRHLDGTIVQLQCITFINILIIENRRQGICSGDCDSGIIHVHVLLHASGDSGLGFLELAAALRLLI
jgi:hypothetical protein